MRSGVVTRRLVVCTVAVLCACGLPAGAAAAATFTVNDLGDAADAAPGNGVCATGASTCTLRAAVQETKALSGADTIAFSVTGTINLTGPLPSLGNGSIKGPGASALTVRRSSGGDYPVFNTHAGNLTISKMTISNGHVSDNFGVGGGILNGPGTLTLKKVVVSGNSVTASDPSGAGAGGGGIVSIGNLVLDRSTVSGNSATATSTSPTGSANAEGGGVLLTGGTATIENSTISGNTLTATTTNTQPNLVVADGAGVSTGEGQATVTILNSTITQNTATDTNGGMLTRAFGGGLFTGAPGSKLTSVTLARNSAPAGANASFFGAPPKVKNTIVAYPQGGGENCDGAATSSGHNLEDDATGACGFSTSTDRSNVDPLLGTLASNGGLTQTLALQSGSPAIDAGVAAKLTTDQRGLIRPFDFSAVPNINGSDGSDIGAFERNPFDP